MKKQAGFTLIEIMIALVLGLIVLSATIGIYVSTVKGSTDTINSARLNHDLDSVMSLMVNDIRRAGYWGGAIAGANSAANPFISETTNVTNIQLRNLAAPTTALAAGAAGNCILYTYDADGSGVNTPLVQTDDVDANEYYGFRLNGSTINMRRTGTTAAPASCTNGDWEENIAGDQITITALTFSTAYKCLNVTTAISYNTPCAEVTAANLATGAKASESRQLTIVLTGRLVNDTTVTKTLTNTVKVRTDRIFTQP